MSAYDPKRTWAGKTPHPCCYQLPANRCGRWLRARAGQSNRSQGAATDESRTARSRPQPAEADISPNRAASRFDPSRTPHRNIERSALWPGQNILNHTHFDQLSPPWLAHSKRHIETREEYIGSALIQGNLGSERTPEMLVAWDQPNCGCNCKVVKDLHALFVLGSRCSCREKSDVTLQIAADPVVEKADAKAVIFPSRQNAMGNECHAGIALHCVRISGCIAQPSEYADAVDDIPALEFPRDRRRIISDKEIL